MANTPFSSGVSKYEDHSNYNKDADTNKVEAIGGKGSLVKLEKPAPAELPKDVDLDNASPHHTLGVGKTQAIPAALLENIAPIAEIIQIATLTAGVSLPRGIILANGASYPISTYPQLFAKIGYAHGGAGANFNVPNVAGRYVRATWGQ